MKYPNSATQVAEDSNKQRFLQHRKLKGQFSYAKHLISVAETEDCADEENWHFKVHAVIHLRY